MDASLLATLIHFDEIASSFIVLPQSFRPFLKLIEYAVHGFPWVLASSLTAIVAYSYRWDPVVQHSILVLNIGLLLDLAVVGAIKVVVQRERPIDNEDDQVLETPIADQYSFPSGHTSRSALLSVLACHFLPSLRPLFIPLPFLVAYSRVAMARHYLTDVLAGLALGVSLGFVSLCTPLAVNTWMRRLFA